MAKLPKTEIPYEVTVDTSQADSSLDSLETSLDGVQGAAGGAIDSIKSVGLAMKALATNPIGLVISAIAAVFITLSAAVKRNEKAMENINKVMAYFKGTIDGVLNALGPLVEFLTDGLLKAFESPLETIKNLGKALLDNIVNRFKAVLVLGDAMSALLKGEFKEAAKLGADAMIQFGLGVENGTDKIVEAGEALADFGNSIVENVDKAIDANKRLANSELELLRIQKAFEIQQLKFQQQAEEQRQIRDDEARSMEERIAANKELGAVLDRQLALELELAQRQLEIAEDRQLVDGVNVETETELLDAKVKIAEINERIHAQRSEQLTNENALIKEQAQLEIDEKKRVEDEKKKADDKAVKDKIKRDKQIADSEKQLQAIKDDLVMQGFGLIGQLAGEESLLGKAASIAEIGVDTYKGATKALASSPPPSPLGAIGASIMIASGIASAAKASGIKFPTRRGASSASGAASTPSISAPSIPSIPSFTDNLTDDINTDSASAAINAQSRAPLKAIVVLDDINNAQGTQDQINDNATL